MTHDARPIRPIIDDGALMAALEAIAHLVREAGGRALLVGGTVRDTLLELPSADLDLEVYGIPAPALLELLGARYAVDLVGEAFGVIKLRGLPIDVSLPRRESCTGLGHRDFEIHAEPDLSPAIASRRRDFTINSMALDPLTGELIDAHGGRRDLAARRLRHTSEQFIEDPLRVLRAMQLASRFELEVDSDTVALCRTLSPAHLPAERRFEEWRKLILLGRRPSRGLEFLRDTGWLQHEPELAALVDCPQDPGWHPEGDVWTHTLHCMDAFANERTGDPWEDLVVGFAVLCHDLGKPVTTTHDGDGRIRSLAHEPAGEAPTRAFLGRLTAQRELADAVVPLVLDHLRPSELFEARAGDQAIRRLARRVGRIDRLVRVARADQRGRPPRTADRFEAGDWLLARAGELAVADAAPRPLVQGRDLIELGLEPGPHFGPVLDACFEAQLDGVFDTVEAGVEYARRWVAMRDGDEELR